LLEAGKLGFLAECHPAGSAYFIFDDASLHGEAVESTIQNILEFGVVLPQVRGNRRVQKHGVRMF
jgi:hypothetical protein